jgi:DNA-binding NarL/FixJ family response regulator
MRERVLMMGGTLSVHSVPGEGTTLSVRCRCDFEEALSVIRVLVAEDHTIVREGIKQLIGLAKDLLVVGEASNGEQLLETLRHVPARWCCWISPCPGSTAWKRLRASARLNNPPAILVLSMHDEAQMAARALKFGAAGYATKDSDPALLLTAIRKVAAGGRYIDPDLADRMVFEVGLTDARPLHALLSEREFSVFERWRRAPTSTISPSNWP